MAPAFNANQLPHGMQPKKKYQPEIAMKKANWNKVNARALEKDSFWVNVNEDKYGDKDIFTELQEKFASAPLS